MAGKLKKGTAGEWEQLVEMDICRDSKLHNVLDDSVFAGLCALAFSGNLMAILGGPNCPTWSFLRHRLRKGLPGVVRGRKGSSVCSCCTMLR